MAESRLAQEVRVCAKCRTEKAADSANFSFIVSRARFHSWCKPCCAEDRRRDRVERPDRYRAADAKRDLARVADQRRARYCANPEKHRERRLARTPDQLERYRRNRRDKYATDPAHAERIRQARNKTADTNRDKYNAQRREACAGATPAKRLRTYFTSAICHSLKGTTKGGRSWEAILGFSAQELRVHLQRQFTRGMTWDNYGEWHVDHIVPLAAHDITDADCAAFKAAWSLTNLRPMWARDNIRKGAKVLTLL